MTRGVGPYYDDCEPGCTVSPTHLARHLEGCGFRTPPMTVDPSRDEATPQFVVKIRGKHKRLVGPFWTRALASAWASANVTGESWRIVELTPIS